MFGSLSRFRDRVQRYFLSKTSDQKPVAWHERHRALMFVMLVAGIFLVTTTAHAQSLTTLKDGVLNILGMIMGEIIAFMGKMIILLVSILISFASYNNFVHAQPVEIGWVLMRDVANMFFIVILLVSAFSTIIGYDEFKWNKVVPKLLLMAVLINFSKTLIGLLIDFSQVLMLTFVNAFRQAAGGNFVTALKLSKVTALAKDGDSPDTYEVSGGLIPAAILGIMMLGISMTLLVIMIGFIIFRIIGLWLLLIMSPMAFFALALPSKLSKALSAFTDSFWSRLSSLLIGGPVMAFFLWLALAVVQGSGGERAFADMYTETNEATSAASFVTEAGNAADIATFIVAVALMLAGVEFSVKTASAVSSSLGKFATAAAAGGGVAVTLARGAARVTRKGAAIGFEGVDRVADVRGFVGRKGLALSARTGGLGQATFGAMAGHKSARTAAQRKAQMEAQGKAVEYLGGEESDAYLRTLASGSGVSAEAARMRLADTATSGIGLRSRTRRIKSELEKTRPDLVANPAQLAAYAEAMAAEQAGKDIKSGMSLAEKMGDDAKFEKYKDAVKKNPSLGSDWSEFGKIKGRSVEDPKRYLQDVTADGVKDSRAFLAHMAALKLVNEETGEIDGKLNPEAWEKMMKGDRGKFAQEHIRTLSKEDVVAQLKAMDGNKDYLEAANSSRRYVSKDDQNKIGSVNVSQQGGGINIAQSFAVRNDAEIAKQRERVSQFRQQGSSENSADVVSAKSAMAGAGASIVETFNFNAKDGTFENTDNREAFESTINSFVAGMKAGDEAMFDKFARLDTVSMSANSDKYNEARAAAISALDVEDLKRAFEQAGKAGKKQAQDKIQEVLRITVDEGKRNEGLLKSSKISAYELQTVAKNPASDEAAPIIQRIINSGSGIGDETQAVEAARAVTIKNQIATDPQLRTIRANVSDKVRGTAGKAGQAVAGAAKQTGRAAARTLKESRQERFERRMEERIREQGGKPSDNKPV